MTRSQLLDQWLDGKMPFDEITRKDFIKKHYKNGANISTVQQNIIDDLLIEWIWNAGFNEGLNEGLK